MERAGGQGPGAGGQGAGGRSLVGVDCGGASAAAAAAVALGRFWVPRIRVLFGAEDPRAFAERVQAAQRARETAEATVLYRLSVARMPVWTGPACSSV
ncbi:hypothetical protein CRUP_020858 [Coryphaenoides rupestris]|nr:hypothetical protein CRUP_020858 [Coryphaenoides rupestris]